ncbi:helix-turn-helix domain-containing protein [Hymenobacter sp. GOD-10R]|uniref:winged helix-turn-helix transcriptional regulator n=1 Tax=Hymenobacter sp. GOD-10R TaxID=3093922 RepID=UPI002D7738DC|nr:helix-turn-helix domain-containing protein [Hymenobacter sp. GOD-10R]WRQ31648.1 helix-turn-helix domain-containing protein [Hymenobacter sp. GOD-10R]
MSPNPIHITPRCPVRTTWELLGGKWCLLLLHQLADTTPRRFSELKQLVPDISDKILMQELKHLVTTGLLLRTPQQQVPARVEYQITFLGQQALRVLAAAAEFGQLYHQQLRADAQASSALFTDQTG